MEIPQSWWLAFVFGILPVSAYIIRSWNEFWNVTLPKLDSGSAKLPPGNMGLPVIGELLTFIWYFKIVRRPDDLINSKRKQYGDGVGMYRTHMFNSPSIIAWSPEAVKFVLSSSELFSSHALAGELINDNSYDMMNGETQKLNRACILMSVNSQEGITNIINLAQPLIKSTFREWAEKGRFKTIEQVRKLTFDNIIESFINFKPGPMSNQMREWFMGLLGGFSSQKWNIPGTSYYHALQCKKKLVTVFKKEFDRRRLSAVAEEKYDLMENLRKIRDGKGNPLSDVEVVNSIIGLILAGYESTSLTATWAIYYLAKKIDVLQKLREENFDLAAKKNGELLTLEDVGKLKYTNKVVEETLRLANIVPFLTRGATKDVVYKGYRIPKGWSILVWVRYPHIDPKNYEDSLNFNPDRWNEPAKPGTFVAFGGGERLCAGNKLARTQLAVFLHHLVTGYKWELVNPDAKTMYIPLPMVDDGLELSFSKI